MNEPWTRVEQPVGFAVPDWQPPPHPGPPRLAGSYCRIEPLEASRHSDALFQSWQSSEECKARWVYLGGCPFDDLPGCRKWLAHQAANDDPAFMAIIDAASHQATGTAAYLNIVAEHGTIELGHLSFSSRLARTPAATEALYLLMRHAFALGYRRLEWKCDALNVPSRRAAERLGFSFEGIFHQHRVVQGHNRDSAWFALLDHQWPRLVPCFRQWLAPENFDAGGRQHTALSTLTAAALQREEA
ncbi:GNAT family N-acetyltransferase [Kushneria phosphatilytica]|uniref:GNAT family N-acetyltransferase n=1 Tax=Kushneria phosphatilytica TaxID=657387 RepID=A0A1S1NWH9_9GAMM|nr:GNAT family protein [Kushneria phosphatilytica]OHV08648.1 GNAT family N-acetyltransferase [Kushneria phosphatilytica]QEL12360.1 GNAT family N-acetyltransferase [Kushneria phosphatilytica]